jgi:epoxyqueuosine reductase
MSDALKIIKQIEAAGLRAAFIPYGAVTAAVAVYEKMAEAEGTPEYALNAAAYFKKHQPPDIPFVPLSFLVVACPSPPARLVLTLDGTRRDIPIPPIYVNQDGYFKHIDEVVAATAAGFKTAHTKGISQKLLAALSGLGRYGRNNIVYIDGMGSHCALTALYTDIPCDGGIINKTLTFMDECVDCAMCRRECPTGAITDAPVVNADLCINKYTYRLDPIPESVPHQTFNALIGCWLCQAACPKNASPPDGGWEALTLNEAETRAFLAYDNPMPPELEDKLRVFFRNEHLLSVAGRNAGLVLRARVI